MVFDRLANNTAQSLFVFLVQASLPEKNIAWVVKPNWPKNYNGPLGGYALARAIRLPGSEALQLLAPE